MCELESLAIWDWCFLLAKPVFDFFLLYVGFVMVTVSEWLAIFVSEWQCKVLLMFLLFVNEKSWMRVFIKFSIDNFSYLLFSQCCWDCLFKNKYLRPFFHPLINCPSLQDASHPTHINLHWGTWKRDSKCLGLQAGRLETYRMIEGPHVSQQVAEVVKILIVNCVALPSRRSRGSLQGLHARLKRHCRGQFEEVTVPG